MRGAARDMVECHMSEEQQGRFSAAQGLLAAPAPASSFVVVGDVIQQATQEDSVLRGHGTQVVDGQLVATVCGAVVRVNKLVYVQHLRARFSSALLPFLCLVSKSCFFRYEPNVGDVVIGRVTEVWNEIPCPDSDVLVFFQIAPKRWKVDINARHHGQLMLSAVNLPGGLQRRRTAVDELNMRELFVEGDLIIAELQDKLNLQTRSSKYGKLKGGQLVQVPYCFVKRLTQHFHQFKQYGVDMVFSCNGNIWISSLRQESADVKEAAPSATTTLDCRENICRLANAVRVLSALALLISPDSVLAVYEESVKSGTEIKDILSPEFHLRVMELEAFSRRNKTKSFA